MIKQYINIDNYWKVVVYYNINYNLFDYIIKDLNKLNTNTKTIINIYKNMFTGKAKAVTISSIKYKRSVVLFNTHKSFSDYINSIIHEAEHIKQAMLKAYNVDDKGEAPAYTIGFIVMKMLTKKILKRLELKNA